MRQLFYLLSISCLLLLSAGAVLAQPGNSITGIVRNSDGSPAFSAIVILKGVADSALVKTAAGDSAGAFSLDGIKPGSYFIQVNMLGSLPYSGKAFSYAGGSYKHAAVTLAGDVKVTGEVEVNAQKRLIVQKQDRTIVNVDMLMSAAGATALDVLEKSPGVQVDQNANISLRGKQGVIVFIDDKPTYLSGTDLENYLRSLPAAMLEQVELMTNPPARYDASGTAVINIRLKKNRVKGYHGGYNLAVTQGKRTRSNNSFNINYRNNKVNTFMNASYTRENNFTDLDLNRTYTNDAGTPTASFVQNSFADRRGNAGSIKLGGDYYVNDKTSFGMVLTGMMRKAGENKDNVSTIAGTSATDSILQVFNRDKVSFNNTGVNLNYVTSFDTKQHTLTTDADWLRYGNLRNQRFYNNSYYPDNTLKHADVLNGYLPNHIDIIALKTDYARPLAKGWNFEAGAKTSYTATNNLAEYRVTEGSATFFDYGKSNEFTYKENINAAYTNLSREGKRLSVQAGLRFENTNANGYQAGNAQKPDSSFTRLYNNLFPTAYLSYKLDTLDNNVLGLNYGRRIERPYYQDLNPFLYPIDKLTYYSGNPFLKPSFNQNFELTHTYKGRLTTAASYGFTTDDNNETIEIREGVYYSRPGNLGRKQFYSLSMNGNFDVTKWFTFNFYSEYTTIITRSAFYTGTLNTKGSFLFANGSTQFNLGKGWRGEVSGFYRTRLTDAQFIIQPQGSLNTSIQKKLGSNTTLRFNVNDILYTRINYGRITNLANAGATWINRNDSRNFTIAISRTFGKAVGEQRRHNSQGAESEQNRVKS